MSARRKERAGEFAARTLVGTQRLCEGAERPCEVGIDDCLCVDAQRRSTRQTEN